MQLMVEGELQQLQAHQSELYSRIQQEQAGTKAQAQAISEQIKGNKDCTRRSQTYRN